MKRSTDGGKTWAAKRSVEAGASAYSDLGAAADGTVLLLYERGGPGRASYGRLTLARFGVEWVRGK